jgi:hypothetical protein
MSGIKGKCKICDSKKASYINNKIVNGDSISSISKLYGFARDTIKRHKTLCISPLLKQSNDEKQLVGDSLVKQVEADIGMIHKLVRACDEWLTDPDDPSKYFIGARGNEIEVVYVELDPETNRYEKVPRKASLQELVDKAENGGVLIRSINIRAADPRELLLKSIAKLEGIVKMILETTQNEIENKHKRAVIDKAASEGSMISFEKQISQITERVTFAMQRSNNNELCKMAGLPEL